MKTNVAVAARHAAGAKSAKAPRVRAVPAVSRAVAILRLLAASREAQSLKAIAAALAIVPSTGLHILRALVAEKIIEVDAATKRYKLGLGLLAITRDMLQRDGFGRLVQAPLDRMSLVWGVTAMGVQVIDLDRLVVLALARSSAPFSLHVDVGSRFPALISASGRLVAAHSASPWPHIEQRFRALRWDRPVAIKTWRRDIESARKQGFSIDRGGYIDGVTLVAVPIFDQAQRLTHTIVCAGVSRQLIGARVNALVHDMQSEARMLETQLIA